MLIEIIQEPYCKAQNQIQILRFLLISLETDKCAFWFFNTDIYKSFLVKIKTMCFAESLRTLVCIAVS